MVRVLQLKLCQSDIHKRYWTYNIHTCRNRISNMTEIKFFYLLGIKTHTYLGVICSYLCVFKMFVVILQIKRRKCIKYMSNTLCCGQRQGPTNSEGQIVNLWISLILNYAFEDLQIDTKTRNIKLYEVCICWSIKLLIWLNSLIYQDLHK